MSACSVCTSRPSTETCPRLPNDPRLPRMPICGECHASMRLAYACQCMSTEQARARRPALAGSRP